MVLGTRYTRRRRMNRRAPAGPALRRARVVPRFRGTSALYRSRVGGVAQPVQFFKRTTYTNAFVCSSNTLGDQFKNLTFHLNDVPNFVEFTSLYDQYCIKGVKFTLMPRYNSNTPDAGFAQVPQTWSILDYDGSFPASQTQMLQYQNLKMKAGTKFHKRYLVPAIATELFESPVSTAYSARKNVWIDTANPTVPHYGATIMIPAVSADSESCWDLKVEYYLAFKNVR